MPPLKAHQSSSQLTFHARITGLRTLLLGRALLPPPQPMLMRMRMRMRLLASQGVHSVSKMSISPPPYSSPDPPPWLTPTSLNNLLKSPLLANFSKSSAPPMDRPPMMILGNVPWFVRRLRSPLRGTASAIGIESRVRRAARRRGGIARTA